MNELVSITVGKLLEQVANTYPDDQAVKYIDRPFDTTWREFNEKCDQIAKGFLRLGIKKGDHVAIWATNVPEWLLTIFACAKIMDKLFRTCEAQTYAGITGLVVGSLVGLYPGFSLDMTGVWSVVSMAIAGAIAFWFSLEILRKE